MSTPPRRRRTESQRPDGGGWLPTIAMGLAVIVAGLGIGALIAVLMQRHSSATPIALTAPTNSPTVSATPTLAPVTPAPAPPHATPHPAPRTPVPTHAPQTPSPSPSALASPTPPATPTALASPQPQATDTTANAASPEAGAAARISHVALVTSVPRPARTPTAEPAATATATVIPTPVVTAAPAAVEPSAYEQHASAIVRRYIDALIRGDQHSAYSALGQSTGATASLPEQAFLDSSAHIISLKVTRIDAANASVGCEIASSKGHYYGTYHVTAGSGGAYITEHDYIKV